MTPQQTWKLKGKFFVDRRFLPTEYLYVDDLMKFFKGKDNIYEIFFGDEKRGEWWPSLGWIKDN